MSAPTRSNELSTKPTELDAISSQLVDDLVAFVLSKSAGLKLYVGVITELDAGPPATLTVLLGEQAIPNMRYLAGYSPAEDDVVLVLGDGSQYVVLADLAT